MTEAPSRARAAGWVAVSGAGALALLAVDATAVAPAFVFAGRIVACWALALGALGGMTGVGLALLELSGTRGYRAAERLVLAVPLGMLAFAAAVLVVGLVGGLGRAFFWGGPALAWLLGAPALRRAVKGLAPLAALRGFRARPVEALGLGLVLLGVLAIYVPALSPHNVQHDARWYHLPIAQQYAASGRVAAFEEGWLLGAYPHLASLLYTWAWLLPGTVVARIDLAAHLEVALVLATLGSVPTVVRRLVGRPVSPVVVGVSLLFPSLFVYDSTVSLGADHVAAVFAPGALLAALAAARTLGARHAALVGVLAGGAIATKFSALALAAPLGASLGTAAAIGAGRGKQRRAGLALAGALGGVLLGSAVHWGPSVAFHGDPFYPLLRRWLPAHPWDAQAEGALRVFMEYLVLRPAPGAEGVLETLLAVATLGFRSTETFGLRGAVPTFGALFTVAVFLAPLVRPPRRVLFAVSLGVAAVVTWYVTNHRERYLQACLPWLAAAAAGVLVTLYHRGRAGRASVLALVAAEGLVSAGAVLWPTHVMAPEGHPLISVIRRIRASRERGAEGLDAPHREWGFADWVALGRELPRGARVLVHEDRLCLGLDREVVVDEAQWQAGIRYVRLESARGVHDLLARFRVTHAVTGRAHSDSGGHGLSGELAFWLYLDRHARRVARAGELTLWELPAEAPADAPYGDALALTCNQSVEPGLYAFGALSRARPLATVEGRRVPAELLGRAEFVAIEDGCGFEPPGPDFPGHRPLGARGAVRFLVRGAPAAGPDVSGAP